MKKVLSIIVCITFLFCSCGKSQTTESTFTPGQATPEKQAQSFAMIEDSAFEVADYQRFNSPASENGLGGTKITFQGTIKEFKTENDYLYYTVATEDGDWHVGIGMAYGVSSSNCEALVGKDVQVFAQYAGFSALVNLPACNIIVEAENNVFDASMRIVTADGTEYPYVPYFWDWNLAFSSDEGQAALENAAQSSQAPTSNATDASPSSAQASEAEQPKLATMGEKNALKSAKGYLNVMPFSHDGLAKQLEYEGYSRTEALYAADNCGADWNAQAAKAAKKYLDTMAFSRQSLIDQLKYEGYTTEQATYGATENGY